MSARILVIDDEPSILALLKTMLTRAGYRAFAAQSGLEGLAALQAESFDCILTDAMMPGMSGYDVVRVIRQDPKHANVPILMLTRKKNREDVKLAIDAGVNDYIVKPVDEEIVLEKVGTCLNKSDAKKELFELAVDGPEAESRITLRCRAVRISESGLSLRLAHAVSHAGIASIEVPLLKEIGLDRPTLRLIDCQELYQPPEHKDLPFEAKVGFVGLTEADLKKIRAWIQKESVRRKK